MTGAGLVYTGLLFPPHPRLLSCSAPRGLKACLIFLLHRPQIDLSSKVDSPTHTHTPQLAKEAPGQLQKLPLPLLGTKHMIWELLELVFLAEEPPLGLRLQGPKGHPPHLLSAQRKLHAAARKCPASADWATTRPHLPPHLPTSFISFLFLFCSFPCSL